MDERPVAGEHLHRRELRLAGLLATGLCLTGLWVVGALTPKVPFAPISLAEALVRVSPGDLSTFFIEALGPWAIRLLAAGAVIGALLVGGEILVVTSGDEGPRPFVAGIVLAAAAAIAIVLGPMDGESPIGMTMVLSITAVSYAWIAKRLFAVLTAEHDVDASRRRALRIGLGGAIGIATVGGVVGWFAKRFGGPDTDVELVLPAQRASLPARPDFPDIRGLTPEITSVADHYIVDINLVPPSVEADGWDLTVQGLVDEPLTLDFVSLQRRFEVVEEHSVLTCISNEVGGSLVGHSVWGGVRLRDVLEAAGPTAAAIDVIFRADDGYSDSIPLDVAMDPSTLIAVSQNGEPLTQEHGFPCRIRVPMIYGMKNVKWLREIEVVDLDYQGYWMERGWSDVATVRTQSRVDVVGDDRRAEAGTATWIAGVAWSGGRGISKVEVSTDDGSTWDEAMLREPVSTFSWTLWAYRWTPSRPGSTTVVCRATDGTGDVQTAEPAPPHPAGATGYHRVSVTVT